MANKKPLLERLLTAPLKRWGFEIVNKKQQELDHKLRSFAAPTNMDGAITSYFGGMAGTYATHVDFMGDTVNEVALINKYREMASYQEVSDAIDAIVNQAIILDDEHYPVDIVLDDIDGIKAGTKNKIAEQFQQVLDLLDFKRSGYDIFRRWYVDGRWPAHKIIDKDDVGAGIHEVRYIDPRKIVKVRELRPDQNDRQQMDMAKTRFADQIILTKFDEFYVYNDAGIEKRGGGTPDGLRIKPDTVVFAHSGLQDYRTNVLQSYLHGAIKPYNQLRMMEDSAVIYRIARAPERRVFNVDVSGMQTPVAEKYMEQITNRLRNQINYDISSGEVINQRHYMTMLEDYFMPTREGKGTSIDTLAGGENLGEIADIQYFQKKLFRALKVPSTRFEGDGGIFTIGKPETISRDEVEFAGFVRRLRGKFAVGLFDDLLGTQCVLKKICTSDEFDKMAEHIRYNFKESNFFTELKDAEIWESRFSKMAEAEQAKQAGYISGKWIRTNILKQTEDDIAKIDKEIDKERQTAEDKGMPDPYNPMGMGADGMMAGGGMDPNGGMGMDPMGGGMGPNIAQDPFAAADAAADEDTADRDEAESRRK